MSCYVVYYVQRFALAFVIASRSAVGVGVEATACGSKPSSSRTQDAVVGPMQAIFARFVPIQRRSMRNGIAYRPPDGEKNTIQSGNSGGSLASSGGAGAPFGSCVTSSTRGRIVCRELLLEARGRVGVRGPLEPGRLRARSEMCDPNFGSWHVSYTISRSSITSGAISLRVCVNPREVLSPTR